MERRPDTEIYKELADVTNRFRELVLSSEPTHEALGQAWDLYEGERKLQEERCGKPDINFAELWKKLHKKRHRPDFAAIAEMEFRGKTDTPLKMRGGLIGELKPKERQKADKFCNAMLEWRSQK